MLPIAWQVFVRTETAVLALPTTHTDHAPRTLSGLVSEPICQSRLTVVQLPMSAQSWQDDGTAG